jgi:ABC-type sugar transport system permease subunit
MKEGISVQIKKQIPGYAFMLPGFLFIIVYMGYPIINSFYLSFTSYNFGFDAKPAWTGVTNYIKLFSDTFFLDALKNTAFFTVVFFPSVLVFSLILAMLLNNGIRGSGIFRTLIFLPVVVPLSLSGIIFQWILNENYGLLNWFLADVLHLGSLAKNWLGDKDLAMISIIMVSLWKNIGMLVVMFMAGLQAISNDIIEASRVDGANIFQRIFRIILPNLKESYIICGIWAIIQAIKVFEQPFIMTGGGPGTATLVLYQYTWINAFKYFEMGYASTIAYFMGVVILGLSVINMYINRSDDVKDAAPKKGR